MSDDVTFTQNKPGFVNNPLTKYPAGRDCFCGSGVKFKKCHKGKIPRALPFDQANIAQAYMDAVEKEIEAGR